MDPYQPLLNNLMATRDGLSHRLLFACPAYGYEVPCEIFVSAGRDQIVIAASTAQRLPEKHQAAAAQIAASSCQHDAPFVVIDETSRRLIAMTRADANAVFEPLVGFLLRTTANRLLAVARRIDLHLGGLDVSAASTIDERVALKKGFALRRYRPFRKAKTPGASGTSTPTEQR